MVVAKKRVARLNSLLKEVISEVVRDDVRDPRLAPLITVTEVEVTSDLRQAKVLISVIGPEAERIKSLEALQSAAGFIAVHASKKVVLRYFPVLTFKLDTSAEKHAAVETLLGKIHEERTHRNPPAQ